MASSQVEAPVQVDSSTMPHTSTGRVLLVVVLVTIIAAALRLYKLGAWSFWIDEMFTLKDSIGTGWRYHGMTYPLSYMLIGASLGHFGVSEWSARIVPALFGIATPAVVYLLARRSFGEIPSIAAAGIIAISPWHLYWSQMARFYTMTVFFSAVSLLVLHRGLEENRRGHIAAAGILMALAALSHYSALLVLGAIAVYAGLLLILRWQRPPGLNLANCLIFLAPFILGAIITGHKAGWLLAKYAAGYPTGTSFSNPITGGVYMVFSIGYRLEPAIALLALIGAWIGMSRRDRGALILTCALVVPTLFLVAAGMMSHAENRYAFVVLPPAALLAGSVISTAFRLLWDKSRVMALALPLIIALPLLQHDVFYFSPVSNGERWNYRAAADYLRSHAKDGEAVYSSMWMPLAYYLKDTNLVVQDLDVGKDAGRLPGSRAWLVMEDATRGESASKQLSSWLEANCSLKAHFPASSPATDYGLSVYKRAHTETKH